jgi:hypothetical protein
MSAITASTSWLPAVESSCVINAAVDCSSLMAAASAVEIVVTAPAMALAVATWESDGVEILYLAKSFFSVTTIAASSAATLLKAVSVGYLAKRLW